VQKPSRKKHSVVVSGDVNKKSEEDSSKHRWRETTNGKIKERTSLVAADTRDEPTPI